MLKLFHSKDDIRSAELEKELGLFYTTLNAILINLILGPL